MSYIYNLGLKYKQLTALYPNKTAIKFCDNTVISFSELDVLSDNIASFFLEKGIKKNQVVAIQNDKTSFGYACILACLKLGIIYTNFDSSNPKERLSKIFDTAKPSLVISDAEMIQSVVELCKEKNIDVFDYSLAKSKELINCKQSIKLDILKEIPGSTPAYIMFTSGSTGIPKGVLIKQESILNFIEWGKEIYNITPDDTLTNVNPIYFDNSVFDFYCSIFNGASLGAFSKDIVSQPKKMLEIIDEMKCTFWFSVPSFLIYLTNLKLLKKDVFTSVRAFSFGGEGYPKEALKKIYDLYSGRADFFNVYGPTETTCICSAYKLSDTDFEDMHGLPTLGHIAPNFGYLILDSDGKESSLGELCLTGPQLALGYYNDPDRTAKSFIQIPFINHFDQKMYKTGDLIEKRSDGKLYFVGRVDNQIKHMGYRIELEEIEAGLIKIPNIQQCAVIHGKTSNGFSRLVAYIATESKIKQEQLRKDLRKYLPDYMIPNLFESVQELPRNQNGKVDRVKLKKLSNLL